MADGKMAKGVYAMKAGPVIYARKQLNVRIKTLNAAKAIIRQATLAKPVRRQLSNVFRISVTVMNTKNVRKVMHRVRLAKAAKPRNISVTNVPKGI